MSHARVLALLLVLGPLVPSQARAAKHHITGQVVDRNGQPVSRAIVALTPGNVELVTDREGWFLIDYHRQEDGKRVRLGKKSDYILEIFKPGFHTFSSNFFYKRGPVAIDTVTMVEETIDVQDFPENLDPNLYSRPTQSSGATYEGQ